MSSQYSHYMSLKFQHGNPISYDAVRGANCKEDAIFWYTDDKACCQGSQEFTLAKLLTYPCRRYSIDFVIDKPTKKKPQKDEHETAAEGEDEIMRHH